MIEIYLMFSAFILAFFALIKRITIFRLNMGFLTMRGLLVALIILGSIALLGILKASFPETLKISQVLSGMIWMLSAHWQDSCYESLQQIIYLALSSVPYDFICNIVYFFWNMAMVFIILYLYYKLTTPAGFTCKNAKRYFEECSLIIASGVEADIRQLIAELSCSIPRIFDLASQEVEVNAGQYAASLIILFSDELFCKTAVKHDPRFIYAVFETVIKNCNRFKGLGKYFITRLIFMLFVEEKSQLHREEPYHGLGQFGTFKKLIFGSIDFLRSDYRPLSLWAMFNKKEINNVAINKYFEIIEFSLERYMSVNDNSSDIFYSALNEISEIIRDNIFVLDRYTEKVVRYSSPYNNLLACSSGLISLIHFIESKAEEFPLASIIQAEGYSYFKNDHNIYGALAHGLYAAIEAFSMSGYCLESIRIMFVELYPASSSAVADPMAAIQDRLNLMLTEKIVDNLTKLHYPAVTASLIYSFGLCEPDQAGIPIHKVLLTELKQRYLRAYNANSEIALDMLPIDTKIDIQLKKLIRRHPIQWIRNKTTQELTLDSE